MYGNASLKSMKSVYVFSALLKDHPASIPYLWIFDLNIVKIYREENINNYGIESQAIKLIYINSKLIQIIVCNFNNLIPLWFVVQK